MEEESINIKNLIKELASSFQIVSIYDVQHPLAQNAIQQLYAKLTEMLGRTKEISFGIADDEVFCGKEVFFDLKIIAKDFIQILKEKDINYIRFKNGLSQEELADFLQLLSVRKKEKLEEVIEQIFGEERFACIQVGRFGQEVSDDAKKEAERTKKRLLYFSSLHADFLDRGISIFDKGLDVQAVDYTSVLNLMSSVLDNITSPRDFLFMLANVKKYDDYTFVHCLNVSILTMFQARYLGLPKEMTVKLAIAGFLHDIGKVVIRKTILEKKGTLTDDEFKRVKNHVVFGTNILLKNPAVDKLPLVVNFQHHMGYHLKGYPKVHFFKRQNLASRLVSISDVYDALRTRRSYREGIPLERVYEIMKKEEGRLFDPYLLDLFFKNMGVWPVGTLVRLDTQEVGIVCEHNPEDILRPKVEIHYDAQENRLEKAFVEDLTEKDSAGNFKKRILRHLNAFGEGKRFIQEIFAEEMGP